MLAGSARDRCLLASYLQPHGHYSGTPAFCPSPRVSGSLTAGNKDRYRYGATRGFPNTSYNATTYFVDVVFSY